MSRVARPIIYFRNIEGFHNKTRQVPFFKKLRQRTKSTDIIVFIFVFLEPLITPGAYIFKVSNKAKVFSDRDIGNYCFNI